jgi:hypothetical protein
MYSSCGRSYDQCACSSAGNVRAVYPQFSTYYELCAYSSEGGIRSAFWSLKEEFSASYENDLFT